MSKLAKRLDAHFVACAAAAGAAVVGSTQNADAAIVWSGVVNIPISNNFFGVYLNIETGAFNNGTAASTAGWDLNPYYGGNSLFQSGAAYVVTAGAADNLTAGTPIGVASTFGTSPTTGNFTLGVDGILGFRFTNGAAATRYGWLIMNKGSATVPGTIKEYAWEDTGGSINAGEVPAPGSLALLALGAIGVAGRRRK